jgi:hypothetical protein
MAPKKEKSISAQIREFLYRNQAWLARETGIKEPILSRKLNEYIEWTQEELDKINKALGTNFKL